MASRGFIELLRLSDLANARETGRKDFQSTQWTGIVFEIAGQKFVAPMGEVSEVLSMPEYTTVPLVQPWLIGLANVRGRLLPLTDLAMLLKVESQQKRTSQKKVLVIDQDKLFSGLVVDQVLGIQQFNNTQYRDESLADDSPFIRFVHGKFVKSNEEWFVFMPSLLAGYRKYADAAV